MVVRITCASLCAGTNVTILLCESEIAVIAPFLTIYNNKVQYSHTFYDNLLKFTKSYDNLYKYMEVPVYNYSNIDVF